MTQSTPTELTTMSAEELGVHYRSGALSPVEVVEAVLAHADRLEGGIGAFYTRTSDLARSEAAASERRFREGAPIGPLDGVPYSIKDLEATRGIRTTYGNALLRDHVPDADTVVVERLRASGGALLGKTVAPHLGYRDSSENLIQGPTRNPWNPERNPGGSSSGAAASVAAGYSPVAQGSDGAGSIRIPSSLCGVVGFKATIGRVPVAPQANYWGTTVHNGPIARSVRDAALLLDVMAGPDERDPVSLYPLPDLGFLSALDTLGAHRPGLRIVASADYGYGVTAPDVTRAVRLAGAALERGGHVVEERAPGWDSPAEALEAMWDLTFAAAFGQDLLDHPEAIDGPLETIIRRGWTRDATEYLRYLAARARLQDQVRLFFDEADYLIAPVMPFAAWPLLTYPQEIDGVALPGRRRSYLANVFNLTGNPALTVPVALSDDGMPIGVQVVGRLHDDIGVLRLAAQLEAAVGFDARPALP